ncbi:hypothetical protein, partial [Escherichia fergusonii]|uniref:hypothetical protein n=1 Tax=Escherichia fergusonii TaxID=564 RepID=UPI001A919C9C
LQRSISCKKVVFTLWNKITHWASLQQPTPGKEWCKIVSVHGRDSEHKRALFSTIDGLIMWRITTCCAV